MSHRHRCPSCGASEACPMPDHAPPGQPSCDIVSITYTTPPVRFGVPVLCERCARRKVTDGRPSAPRLTVAKGEVPNG